MPIHTLIMPLTPAKHFIPALSAAQIPSSLPALIPDLHQQHANRSFQLLALSTQFAAYRLWITHYSLQPITLFTQNSKHTAYGV